MLDAYPYGYRYIPLGGMPSNVLTLGNDAIQHMRLSVSLYGRANRGRVCARVLSRAQYAYISDISYSCTMII